MNSYQKHFTETYEALCKYKINQIHMSKILEKQIYLDPEPKFKKTVILDLDETLIHSNENWQEPCDVVLEIEDDNSTKMKFGINKRPYLYEFLRELKKDFEIII